VTVEPKKAAKRKKPLVSDSTIAAVTRLHDDEAVGLTDEEIMERIEADTRAAKKRIPKPPAKPGDKDFDWATEYPDEEFLVFTAADGTTVGLASPTGTRKLKPGDFRVMSHMEGWQQTFYMIEKVASAAALAISDQFGDDDYAGMMKAWTEWSGTSQGES
jgi:hypothetical protein